MNKNLARFFVIAIAFVLLAAFFAVSPSIFAEEQKQSDDVNIRVSNMANRLDRVMDWRFIPGYNLIDARKFIGKGVGLYKGDAKIYRCYFPKTKQEYQKMAKDGTLINCPDMRIIIYIDVFETPQEAMKNAGTEGMNEGTFSGASIGDKAWFGGRDKKTLESVKAEQPQPSPEPAKNLTASQLRAKMAEDKKKEEEQKKKDEELSKQLESDPENYYFQTLVVVKRNVHIYVSGVNYKQKPDTALLERVAQTLVNSI